MNLSVDDLRNSRGESVVAFTEFANSTRALPNHLFCFFEGKDNLYYVPRIKKYTNHYHPIKCGGRSKVFEVYELIKNKEVYTRYKKAFFIDRDFNEPLQELNPPVFETPCYSIENLYVSSSVFKEILINEFNLSATTNPLHNKYLDLYEKRQEEFHNSVLLFNAWYSCLIDIRNSQRIQTGVELKNKFPKGLINFDLTEISYNYDLEKIKEMFPRALKLDLFHFNSKINYFQSCNKEKIFRGKYELEFLLEFIRLMVIDLKKDNREIEFSFNDALNNDRAIAVFSNYAETPESLNLYIQKVIN
ncbi:DUF4435 domain-containing protein [Flavobacterium columnare]|uniref:DUF4435 domain-containing protein n=1 Tax=Flavobacterium columnare TaxID=996 RepID=A0AAI8GB32_9FLAO|nr:DUF4435 domain-containing protein [Flavobacterium columnare]AMO20052.1 DUF4435 domain-containing protein [Flavobacterium columnare]AUX17996.1 group-specific protein [Flavobacterium columnare]QOG57065.1 DUF4435 domain-containing protein [Flavobacterium columnare]QOG59789.1 DUF4435 domain-containing protein [Flavobacterium columnare]QOG62509.1 DUF4435 domain-containing protein [Flavobacterium columnare]